MTYALVTVLAKMEDGAREIPGKWFQDMPKVSYYVADIVEDAVVAHNSRDITQASAISMERKINTDGLPK